MTMLLFSFHISQCCRSAEYFTTFRHILARDLITIVIIIITDLHSAFRSEDTEAFEAAQED